VTVTPDARLKVEPKSRYGNMKSYVVHGKRYYTKASSRDHVERGLASWYGRKFHGRKTSSGERYDMHQMTAAHKTLPLPSYVLVTNLENGRKAVVRVNDRGPFIRNRIIDLSYAAAKRLDIVDAGTAKVEVRSVDPRDHGGKAQATLRLASAGAAPGPAGAQRARRAAAGARADTSLDRAATGSAAPVYLQVGAFDQRENAERLRKQVLAKVDVPVNVRETPRGFNSNPLYKVQIGPLGSEGDANRLGQRLLAYGIETPLIVNP
jgi:rare lipoprotein A